jgi:hypothetical protein
MMPINEIVEVLRTYFNTEEAVLAAHLYGSHAKGNDTPGSDVDVAILVRQDKPKAERLVLRTRMQTALSKLLRRDVDLVLLNEIGEALFFEVLRKGKIIYEADKTVHRSFMAVRLTRCLEFHFYQERMQKGMIRAMRSARVG